MSVGGRGRMVAGWMSIVVGAAGMVAAWTLLIVAETPRGRHVGVTNVAVAATFIAAGLVLLRRATWLHAAMPAALTAFNVLLLIRTPTTPVPRSAGFSAIGAGSGRFSPLDWLPERDQIKVGATVIGLLGPLVGREEARRVRSITMGLSREADADPGFRASGTHVGAGLGGLIGVGGPDHMYAYVPETKPGERLGLLVFLHGDLGNFKLTTWAWKPLADRERFAVVGPSYGFGFWGPGGVARIRWAIDQALDRFPVDPGRVYLGGISDGGNGVARGGLAMADRLAGLVFISPQMPMEVVDTPEFGDAWRGRPVLVVTGGADWSVRRATVDPAVEAMRRRGVKVDYRVIAEETHFLFFGRREEVFADVRRWIGSSR